MIQRIQTLFLLIALALTSALLFMDLALLANETGLFKFKFNGIFAVDATNSLVMPTYALTILLVVTLTLLAFIIFLFSKRILQIRLCGIALGLLFGLSGLIYFLGKSASKELGAELSFSWAITLPLISMVFVFMAIKAIGKDEALIRSIDRIR